MNKLTFYKEKDNRWYIDLPQWTGSKADLEMVAGADTMLDRLSEGKNSVILEVAEESNENMYIAEFEGPSLSSGGNYIIRNPNRISTHYRMWLCDVTKFVFGYFPKTLYFKKSYENEGKSFLG
jgi:hypothetical protein